MLTTTSTNIIKTSENPDGHMIGQTADSKVGFYGQTPAAQRASADQAAVTTTAATTSTPWGFSTSAQANGIVTLVNEIRATLVATGLMKGGA